jgi:hypothetical protein
VCVVPTITTQPLNNTVSFCEANTATFTVAASGIPSPTYQWQRSTDNGSTWSNVSGATNTFLTITGITVAMSGYRYRANVTNCGGTKTSNEVMLIVEYVFSKCFSDIQGNNGWYYYQFNNTTNTYSQMEWTSGHWQGNYEFCQIAQGRMHPDTNEAVLVWEAPDNGKITIRGMMESFLEDLDVCTIDKDGTRARILKNYMQIWPENDWQYVYPRLSLM